MPVSIFLADDYRANFDSIIRDLYLPVNPSLYVHAPARLDAEMAPDGQETLTAVVPVGHMSDEDNQDWVELRDKACQHVFRRLAMLGINDQQDHIKFEINFTPLSWRKRYNLVKGSTHGLCHNLTSWVISGPITATRITATFFHRRQHPPRHRPAHRHGFRTPIGPTHSGCFAACGIKASIHPKIKTGRPVGGQVLYQNVNSLRLKK